MGKPIPRLVGLFCSFTLFTAVLFGTLWLLDKHSIATTGTALAQGTTPSCTQILVPAITHGFTTSATLPMGDLFLLPQPLALSVVAPAAVGGRPGTE